jgi:hypothetical protein
VLAPDGDLLEGPCRRQLLSQVVFAPARERAIHLHCTGGAATHGHLDGRQVVHAGDPIPAEEPARPADAGIAALGVGASTVLVVAGIHALGTFVDVCTGVAITGKAGQAGAGHGFLGARTGGIGVALGARGWTGIHDLVWLVRLFIGRPIGRLEMAMLSRKMLA